MHIAQFWHTLLIASLSLCGAVGLLALVRPRLFAAIATWGSRWINFHRFLDFLDRRVDVDRLIIPHSRILGGAVLASVSVLGYVFFVS